MTRIVMSARAGTRHGLLPGGPGSAGVVLAVVVAGCLCLSACGHSTSVKHPGKPSSTVRAGKPSNSGHSGNPGPPGPPIQKSPRPSAPQSLTPRTENQLAGLSVSPRSYRAVPLS